MSDNTTVSMRNDLVQLASNIEAFAKQFKEKLQSSATIDLDAANEIVRNHSTFAFTLGGVCSLEQKNANGKTVKATHVANYHNVRDAHGRFARKV